MDGQGEYPAFTDSIRAIRYGSGNLSTHTYLVGKYPKSWSREKAARTYADLQQLWRNVILVPNENDEETYTFQRNQACEMPVSPPT